jgi:cytoskeletal protein RodZ
MAESFGDILVEAREDVGLSPAELAKITRIPRSSIVALEGSDFDALPAPVFVRGFIRAYCREVDLDPSDALSAFDDHLHEEEIVGDNDSPDGLGPLLFVGSDVPQQPSGRGLQIGHMLLLLLALVTFIIAYVTSGIPSDHTRDVPMDRASNTSQPATTTTGTASR